MTVSEYLNQWLATYCAIRLAENTIRGYRVNVEKHINPYIGHVELEQLSPSEVQQLYSVLLEKGLSATSVLYVHAVLRRAFNCAIRQRILKENVIYCVYPPRRVRFRNEILVGQDLVRLVAACEGTDIYVPVLLGATLGLRRGEILGLKWSDVSFVDGTLCIQRTATFYKGVGICLSEPKTQTSNRTLLLSPYVLCRLDYLKKNQEGVLNRLDLVNCRPSGEPLTSAMLNKLYRAALLRAGLPHIRFHDLRHSNATLMLKNKVPAKIVSSILGHANVGVTLDIYSHVLTDMQEPAVAVINNLFA